MIEPVTFPTDLIDLVDVLAHCRRFVRTRAERGQYEYYARRSGQNALRAQNQDLHAKLGEWATYFALDLTESPDMNVYDRSAKSWDLDFPTYGLDVKTKRARDAERYGASWIFQDGVIRKLEHEPATLIAFAIVDPDNVYEGYETGYVETVLRADTVLANLRATERGYADKQALYLDDVREEVPAWTRAQQPDNWPPPWAEHAYTSFQGTEE
jgi:hypothetical protein